MTGSDVDWLVAQPVANWLIVNTKQVSKQSRSTAS